jgi:predicted transcriptional regulator
MDNKQQQPVFPEEKTDISRDTAYTIKSILESYNERGQQFVREGIEYTAITLLTTISNLYLIKKYNTNCFMYGDQGKDDTFMYGGITLNFVSGQLEIPIEEIQNNTDILSQINGKNLFQIKNFLNCIKNNQPVIIIPLLLEFADGTHHANMLIYRKELNTIEHFEPHGSFLDLRKDYGDKVNAILQLIIDKINETNSNSKSQYYNVLPGNIRLTPSNEVCIRTRGLQAIQQQLRSFSIEGPGYCQMWSLMFAELALLNPTINSKDILDEIYKLLETQDGSIFLSNVIRGYVSMLGDEISLYLSEYINNAFTIENISYICRVLFPYARYLSEILTFIVYIEVNVDLLFRAMPKTMAQLDDVDSRLQGSLSNYFRLQNELKELLINRKRNYSIRGKDVVDAEIVAKLREEFNEYYPKKREIKNYVQNKIFQNYLRNRQQVVAVVEKKSKATKATATASKAEKKVEEVVNVPVIVEAPKRGRKKAVEVVEVVEEELPAAAVVETTTNQRKSTRTTKKGGKRYKKRKSRKHRKTKKYKKNKK